MSVAERNAAKVPAKRLLYFTDPMCSWCWGFSPVAAQLTERFADRARLEVVLGGLAPGAAAWHLDTRSKAEIREHWDHVREATGQPFDYRFFDREGFVYDTEPPSRAVVAARRSRPGSELAFLAHLQGAFYRDNQDITETQTLCELAESFGFSVNEICEQLGDDELRQATSDDFVLSRDLGVRGFPSLLGHDGERLLLLATGYRPFEQVERTVEAWLEGTALIAGPGTPPS